MKTKSFAVCMLTALLVLTTCTLAACGSHSSAHKHTYDTAHWVSDETDHWHAATCEHNQEKKDLAPHEWEWKYDATSKTWNEACDVCARSKGTAPVPAGSAEEFPVPIHTAEEYLAMASGGEGTVTYYRLMNDLTLDGEGVTAGEENGWKAYHGATMQNLVLDGGGNKLTCLYQARLFDGLINATIKNLDVETHAPLLGEPTNVTLESVDTYGERFFSGGNNAVYAIYARENFTMRNCTNYATVNATGDEGSYNAVFVGYPLSSASRPQTLTFENCKNAGKFASGLAAMFVGNASAIRDKATKLEIVHCGNIDGGEVRGTFEKTDGKINPFCAIGQEYLGEIRVDGAVKDVNDCDALGAGFVNGPQDVMNLVQNDDGTFSFRQSGKEGVAYYVVSVGLYTTWQQGDRMGSSRVYRTERIEANGENYTTTLKNLKFVDAAWLAANPSAEESTLAGHTVYTLGNETYYLITESGCSVDGQARAATIFSVSAYSADGKLISSVGLSKK